MLVYCLLPVLVLGFQTGDFPNLTGPYLGQKPPGMTPEIFAPGIISTEFHEHSFPSFSPDGNHVLFTRGFISNYTYKFPIRILSIKNDDRWSFPEFADFISQEETSEAYFSPDGARIYYSVYDEVQNSPDGKKSFDIWYVEKNGQTWSAPIKLGKAINTEKNELQATVTKNLTLYYLGPFEKGKNNYGIYRSKFLDGKYATSELLPDSINSGHTNWTPFIAPDESYLLFSSDRPGGYGSGDIFVSFRRENDTWTDPINLGPPINSANNERYPYVSPDGKYLFYVSDKVSNALLMEKGHTYREYEQMYKSAGNGWSDVYWIEARVIEELRTKEKK